MENGGKTHRKDVSLNRLNVALMKTSSNAWARDILATEAGKLSGSRYLAFIISWVSIKTELVIWVPNAMLLI